MHDCSVSDSAAVPSVGSLRAVKGGGGALLLSGLAPPRGEIFSSQRLLHQSASQFPASASASDRTHSSVCVCVFSSPGRLEVVVVFFPGAPGVFYRSGALRSPVWCSAHRVSQSSVQLPPCARSSLTDFCHASAFVDYGSCIGFLRIYFYVMMPFPDLSDTRTSRCWQPHALPTCVCLTSSLTSLLASCVL